MLFPEKWVIPRNCLSPDSNDLYRQQANERLKYPNILQITGARSDYSPKVGMSSQIPREILGWLGSEKFMLSEVSPDHSLRIDARLSGLDRQEQSSCFHETAHPSRCTGLRVSSSLKKPLSPSKTSRYG